MEGPPLGPGGEDITWPDQVAPRGRKASSIRKMKPQNSNRQYTAGGHTALSKQAVGERIGAIGAGGKTWNPGQAPQGGKRQGTV